MKIKKDSEEIITINERTFPVSNTLGNDIAFKARLVRDDIEIKFSSELVSINDFKDIVLEDENGNQVTYEDKNECLLAVKEFLNIE